MVYYDKHVTEREMAKSGVGWFKFDEPSGNTSDSKGTTLGTVTGTTRVSGVSSNALRFNGTSDYVQFNQKVIPVGKKSIRFKVKKTGIPTVEGVILSSIQTSAFHGEKVTINASGSLIWYSFKGTSGDFRFSISSGNICDGQWHDVLLTWDGTINANAVKMYVDNMNNPVSQGVAKTLESTVAQNNLRLGANNNNATPTTEFLQFELDELEIYNNVIDTTVNKSFILLSDGYKRLSQGSPAIINELPSNALTSNTGDPSFKVSASSFMTTGTEPFKAFDKSVSTSGVFTNAWATLDTIKTGWIKAELDQPKKIVRYSLQSRNATSTDPQAMPVSWIFQGSNDDLVWTDLDIRNNQNAWSLGERRHYEISNTNSYKFYRISVSQNGGHTFLMIGEIYFYLNDTPATSPSFKTISPTLPTLPIFQTEGMDDLSIFDRKVQTVLESPKVMTSEVLGVGKVYKSSVDLKKYFDLRKIEVK